MAALEPPVLMAPVIASQQELWMRRRGREGAESMAALEAPFFYDTGDHITARAVNETPGA